jgi:membrane fusion protein (multidrug efflux system)
MIKGGQMVRGYWQVILGGLLVGCIACGEAQDGTQQAGGGPGGRGRRSAAASPVKVEPVLRADISQYILKNTALEAERWVEVRSRTTGQVVAILKEEGDPIRVGNVIARLDSDAARINVLQRDVAFREANQRHERESALFERNLGSKENYENSKTQLEASKAQLEQAQLSLSYTTITSPIAGVMTLRNIEVGNMVTNNQVVGAVAKFDPLVARIQVTEKDFGKIDVGQTARISVEAFPDRDFAGMVKMISPVVDPESGTVKVTVEVPRPKDGLLRPGMFASVFIITETRKRTLVIPKKALVLEGAGNQVFVYEIDAESGQGKAQRKTVQIGFTDSDRLEVVSGLSEGDQVITVGQEGLRPGANVRLVGVSAAVASTGKPDSATKTEGRSAGQKGGPAGVGVAGGDGQDRNQRMIAMIQRTPDAKKEYDARLTKDPGLAKDPEKLRSFVAELREKGVLQARGRRGN